MSRSRPRFALEDGLNALRGHFDRVAMAQYHDVLVVPIDPLEVVVGPLLFETQWRQMERIIPEGVSHSDVLSSFRYVMRSHATDGLLRINADIGTLTATEPR